MPTVLTFTNDGLGCGVYTEAIDLSQIGQLSVRRVTQIEFDDCSQDWRVYDRTGFPMYSSPSREVCLEWERRHLESQEELKHALR